MLQDGQRFSQARLAKAEANKNYIASHTRESKKSWAETLRDLRNRGLEAPMVAAGDGALGLWGRPGRGLSHHRAPTISTSFAERQNLTMMVP